MTQWHPHKTVATVVERDQHFLMVEESIQGKIVYNQPAGHLEAGESLSQAAIRETLEETAWLVRLTGVLGIYQYTSRDEGICYLRTCFIGEPDQHFAERPLDTGVLRAVWMTQTDIEKRCDQLRSPIVLRVIDDYLAGKHYPLELVQSLD
ncbi:MAG: NUDIX hydrolase [Gammaproteobacteria bacterium]|nr:NUDIX hydrolase [Gammaproteobacteria bacterium]MDP2141204.1 NUDIX hydrolase [Gammaproteobacteria bacterium]MDP2349122.1 NUDIX hydrolase [Gammaproteobacteria bacterium]